MIHTRCIIEWLVKVRYKYIYMKIFICLYLHDLLLLCLYNRNYLIAPCVYYWISPDEHSTEFGTLVVVENQQRQLRIVAAAFEIANSPADLEG
mmetsp:Transcript_12097/g.15037  ORF Transcript_12097/g.15037 Transcript_12097/m.15037 type:complete len:93 (+) Transcript_12097:244-522(+)